MAKKSKKQKLKEKAWKLCSIYVRLKNANESGFCRCFTCEKWSHWRNFHAGHFVDGRGNSILFDTRGIRPQCYLCNIHKSGNPIEFMIALEQEMGKRKAMKIRDELVIAKRQPKSMSEFDYEELITDFDSKITDLLEEKGLNLE